MTKRFSPETGYIHSLSYKSLRLKCPHEIDITTSDDGIITIVKNYHFFYGGLYENPKA